MSTNKLLKNNRKILGLSQKDVANSVGVSEATVSRWESGNIANMGRDKIALLSKVLHIDPSEITGYSDDDNDTLYIYDNIFPINRKSFPMLGEIACGKPIFVNEDRESYVSSGTEIAADFCLKAKGDSMIGARILNGDIVFIKKQSMVDDGEIAAVIIEDEATLKRVYYNQDKQVLQLVAENPKYPPMIFTGEELNEITILGKAIAFQSDIK